MSSSGKAEDARSFSTYRKCDKIQTDSAPRLCAPLPSPVPHPASCILYPAGKAEAKRAERKREPSAGRRIEWAAVVVGQWVAL